MKLIIFISSVQGEFGEERRMLKDYIEHNPVLRRFFDVFIFEDVPPTDRRADEVYLEELAKSQVYLALIGARYCGGADAEVSPTECEYGTINPGITIDQLFKKHASYPNNPRIADPLFYTKHIERLGTGLTDLREACRAAGLPDPEAEIDGNTYSIAIHRKIQANTGSCDPVNGPVNDPVNDAISQLVLKAIRNHPGIRRNVIAQIAGVSETTIKRRLKEMSRFVKFRGAPKTGGYYIVGA